MTLEAAAAASLPPKYPIYGEIYGTICLLAYVCRLKNSFGKLLQPP